jgi:hypothetical protein
MHLSFDTLDELDAFLDWARFKQPKYALQQLLSGPTPPGEFFAGCDGEVTQQVAPSAEPSETATTAPEGAKRKRRTKAEIEAEKAATPPAEWPFTPPVPAETVVPEVVSAPPVELNATPVETLTEVVSTLPVELNAVPTETLTDKAKAWIAQLAAKLGVVDAAKHLDQCRAFIQAHGMAAYAAAGALVELTSSPVGFDDAQRALHSAALEYWATVNPA